MHMLHHESYRSIFDAITDNADVNRAIYESVTEILEHRDQSIFEDLHLINGKTGEIICKLNRANRNLGVKYDSDALKKIEAAKEKKIPIISVHNHPNNTPPSPDDGSAACYRGYDFGIVVGHNLSLYKYTPTKHIIPEDILEIIAEQFQKRWQNKVEIDETAWYNELRKYGMEVTRYDR